MTPGTRELERRAKACGVQVAYADYRGERQRSNPDAIEAITSAVEAGAKGDPEPVVVAWGGRVPKRFRTAGRVTLEDGSTVGADDRLPFGYHRLEAGDATEPTLVISAPRKAPSPAPRSWGVFAPVYALRSERNWGIGDLTDLEALLRWTTALGGDFVSTLPLQATFLRTPKVEPSPYSPITRLFYNEAYVDPCRAPEFERSDPARKLVSSRRFRDRTRHLRATDLVDHEKVYALKREVLEHLSSTFFEHRRRKDLDTFIADEPLAADHASFRSAVEQTGAPPRRRTVRTRIGDADTERYHVYAQLLAHEQLADVAKAGGLHLDLPLGVHPDGYDTWRFADHFAEGMSVGAPPDELGPQGQDWGFPPLHPVAARQARHAYFIRAIRKLVRFATMVRIDHVMGLHRLYWVPTGMTAERGAYVTYPADELYAICVLEAHRAGCALVGEDLGTVPAEVRTTMRKRGVRSTYVAQFELQDDARDAIRRPDVGHFACVNTHDLPPFGAFFDDLDRGMRTKLATYLAPYGASKGSRDAAKVASAILRFLAAGRADVVLATLEDLWGEKRPQNVPGTSGPDHPNWRRPMARTLEDITTDDRIARVLRDVAQARREPHE